MSWEWDADGPTDLDGRSEFREPVEPGQRSEPGDDPDAAEEARRDDDADIRREQEATGEWDRDLGWAP